MKAWLTNDEGMLKEVKIGFSWTMLFFGALVPLHRTDWLHLLISLILTYLTQGLSWIAYPFIYNRLYIKKLLSKGWYSASPEDYQKLTEKGFNVTKRITSA